jgi:hypothetical protein
MDVAAWLRGSGLEQHAPTFRDNDVDGEVLPELTADDLISIGVTSVGQTLLTAIAALGTEPPTVVQSAASATSAPISPPTIDDERRHRKIISLPLTATCPLPGARSSAMARLPAPPHAARGGSGLAHRAGPRWSQPRPRRRPGDRPDSGHPR